MSLRLLQLNIEEGKQYEEIVSFVKKHDFDILHFQEVTSGRHNIRGMEAFAVIKQALGYDGLQGISWRLQGDPSTYFSNSTFFKPSLTPVSSKTVYLNPYEETTEETLHDYTSHTHCALDVVFMLNGKNVHFLNTHLAWGPTPVDEPYKVEQGKVLYEYIKGLSEPFVLSGDFNVTPDSQIVTWMNELGKNHVVEAGITNTLNPNTHRVQKLFPEGLAVDFLFTDPSLQTTDFQLIDTPDLSDHYGLSVVIEAL